MWATIGAFLTGLVEPVTNHFTTKAKIKAATKERKDELQKLSLEAKIISIQKSEDSSLKLDENTENRIAWADDLTLILFLLPFVLAFYPPALPHIVAGFTALDSMPEWYKYSLGMMLVSVWGYRNLVSPIIQSVAKAYLGRSLSK